MRKTTYKHSIKPAAGHATRAGIWLATLALVAVTVPVEGQTAVAAEGKKSPWEGSAALGLTVTRGNSDTLLFNLNIHGTRKREQNELRLGLDATYGENDGDKNNEQIKGFSQYNRIFGDEDRWYFYARAEGLHDAIADIEGRFNVGPGIGYYFIKNEKMSLSGEAGPGAVFEKIGDSGWKTYYTVRVAERFEYKINARARLWQSAEFMPEVIDLGNYIINAEIGIETAITEKWGLRVVLQNTYDHEPAPGREENDLKLVAGVSYRF